MGQFDITGLYDYPGKIRTYSGTFIDPLDPSLGDIHLDDIAHALSMMPRFGGQLPYFYSVARHSVAVADLVGSSDPVMYLTGLLHDASEAYLLDLPKPIKAKVAGYKKAENRLMERISERFGTYWPLPKAVKDADEYALRCEWHNKMLLNGGEANSVHAPFADKSLFMKKYFEQRPHLFK